MVEKHTTLNLAHYVVSGLAFGLVLLSGSLLWRESTNASVPLCSSQVQIVNPAPAQVIDNQFPLELYRSGSGIEINQVKFFLDDDNLGNASLDTANPNFWRLYWDTTTVANGMYHLEAEVDFTGTEPTCVTPAQQIFIDNDTATNQSNLEIEITPHDWSGPTNVNFQFDALATLVDEQGGITNVTPNTSFMWSTTVGSINSVGSHGDFFSGPNAGDGKVKVIAQYGTRTKDDKANVNIFQSSGNTSSYPSTEDSTGDQESSPRNQASTSPVISTGQGDRLLADCIRERLGDESYTMLIAQRARPTTDQFRAVQTCFAQRNFVVPSNLAPVDPSEIRNLPEYSRLHISGVRNSNNSNGDTTLELSGTSDPDSIVLIVIFSEPLVLSAQTDGDGRWSYTLEDPLDPGDHEAYVMVETDGEYRRSGVFDLAIAQGEVTDENPNGYGLTLAATGNSSQSTTLYIAGVAAVVLIASVFLTRLVWFKKAGGVDDSNAKNEQLLSDSPPTITSSNTNDPEPAEPSDEQPGDNSPPSSHEVI